MTKSDQIIELLTEIRDLLKPKKRATSARFTPPTADEVKAYALTIDYLIDSEQFVDFYSSKNWMVGKNKMKDWKASVRTWKKSDSKTSDRPVKCLNCQNPAEKWSSNKGLCGECVTNWYKVSTVGWGSFPNATIERTLEKAKTYRPRPKTKDKEMVNADRQREYIEKLANEVFIR